MDLPDDVILTTAYRIAVLVFVAVLGFAVRRRYHWPVGALIVFGLASNVLYFMGNLSLAGLLGVPYVGLVGWVLIDYLRSDPSALRAHFSAREEELRTRMHDLENDNAALRARLHVGPADA